MPQGYISTTKEYIPDVSSDEDIPPEPLIDETLEPPKWERGSFSIYRDSEQEEMSERHDEMHDQQREEDKGRGVEIAANKDETPDRLQDTTWSTSTMIIVDPPSYSRSCNRKDSCMSSSHDIEHHKNKVDTWERKWDNILPFEDNNQVDLRFVDDQHGEVFLLEELPTGVADPT